MKVLLLSATATGCRPKRAGRIVPDPRLAWCSAGLAIRLTVGLTMLGLTATGQTGMVVKTDPPARQAGPASAPAALETPEKAAAPAPSSPPAAAVPRPSPARASLKTAPPAADRSLPRPGGETGPTGQLDRPGWPACIRQLNAAALSEDWDAERRQALLEQCQSGNAPRSPS